MPKYVEIKDKEGQPAGYVMDYENGYKEVHDKSGQPAAYVYDQEKMCDSVLENSHFTNSAHVSKPPTIEEDGRLYCVMYYGSIWALRIYPLICLLFGWPSMVYSFIYLFVLRIAKTFIIEPFNKFEYEYTKPTKLQWCYLFSLIWGYLLCFCSAPFITF